jgi:hypothetical protein
VAYLFFSWERLRHALKVELGTCWYTWKWSSKRSPRWAPEHALSCSHLDQTLWSFSTLALASPILGGPLGILVPKLPSLPPFCFSNQDSSTLPLLERLGILYTTSARGWLEPEKYLRAGWWFLSCLY